MGCGGESHEATEASRQSEPCQTCPHPVRKRELMKGLSDANLQRLYRKAAYKSFNDKCFFCGAHRSNTDMEIHHPNHRNGLLLKYDYRNAIPCCKWAKDEYALSCHQFAETPEGKKRITAYQDKMGYTEYLQERSGSCKQFFVERGITRTDFLKIIYNDLKEYLNE